MLRRWIFFALLWPLAGLAAGGKVVNVEPGATVEQAGQTVSAAMGMTIDGGTVVTGPEGRIQLRMGDGAMLALPPNSELRLAPGADASLSLVRGGLRLTTTAQDKTWLVRVLGRDVRASGFLKLQTCAEGCAMTPGVYGRAAGEAIVEYEGGRSVLKGKVFRLSSGGARPVIIPVAPALLEDTPNYRQADLARAEVARKLAQGIEAFRDEHYAAAREQLEAVQAAAPAETVVPYYLGLIALKEQRNTEALHLLQQYAREDPLGAAERGVAKTITLLSTQQFQEEVASALTRESALAGGAPEPNSIAVQAFSSSGDPISRAMAKGIAAMIISDLSVVPGLKVLEREKVQLLLDEMKLGASGLSDPATAVRTGRLMRAEKVVVGTFGVQ